MTTNLIVLAAGKGTRMQSDLPKVLHRIGHAPIFVHALKSGAALKPARTVLVAGPGAEALRAAAHAHDPAIEVVEQRSQQGTGHAVAQARETLRNAPGDTFVLYGDTPFIRPDTLARMEAARAAGAAIVVLGFHAAEPGRYGRLLTQGDMLERIVEFKDATESERALTLCNSGVLCADTATLFDLVDGLGNDNASGEYYLTDIVGLARARGLTVAAVTCDESETLGINTRAELARAEAQFQTDARTAAIEGGAQLLAPETVFLAHDTTLGRDAVVEQNVVFGPGVSVASGARIRAFSHLEGAQVGPGAEVGPYARLRPGTDLDDGARIGNFVEVKAARIGPGAKVNHLSYIGDATIGASANIGAGTVTCNYDGVSKHHTRIGAGAFIGSDTMLVAPVSIGDEAMTASGSVITEDVPDGALALARARQVTKPGLARRLFDKLRAAAKEKG